VREAIVDPVRNDTNDFEPIEEVIVDVEPTSEGVYEAQPVQVGSVAPQYQKYVPANAPVANPAKGLATAALICGICSVVFPLLPILSLFSAPVGIAAIILGVRARKRTPEGFSTGMATAAIVTGVLGIFAFIALVALSAYLVSQPEFMELYNELLGTNF